MTATRRQFVHKAVALPLALAALPSSRLVALAEKGLAAESPPDLGSYEIGTTLEGHCLLRISTPDVRGASFPREIEVLRFADGSGQVTVFTYGPRTMVKTRTVNAAFCDALFEVFDEEDGAK